MGLLAWMGTLQAFSGHFRVLQAFGQASGRHRGCAWHPRILWGNNEKHYHSSYTRVTPPEHFHCTTGRNLFVPIFIGHYTSALLQNPACLHHPYNTTQFIHEPSHTDHHTCSLVLSTSCNKQFTPWVIACDQCQPIPTNANQCQPMPHLSISTLWTRMSTNANKSQPMPTNATPLSTLWTKMLTNANQGQPMPHLSATRLSISKDW